MTVLASQLEVWRVRLAMSRLPGQPLACCPYYFGHSTCHIPGLAKVPGRNQCMMIHQLWRFSNSCNPATPTHKVCFADSGTTVSRLPPCLSQDSLYDHHCLEPELEPDILSLSLSPSLPPSLPPSNTSHSKSVSKKTLSHFITQDRW